MRAEDRGEITADSASCCLPGNHSRVSLLEFRLSYTYMLQIGEETKEPSLISFEGTLAETHHGSIEQEHLVKSGGNLHAKKCF